MSAVEWGLAVIGAGLGTYFLRLAPFVFDTLRHLGERYLHFLTYVSFAIAAGIVSKALLVGGDGFRFDADLLIKLTALGCAVVFYRLLRSMPAALFAGVAVAVGLKWLFN